MSAATAPQGARELLENMLGHLGFAFTLEEEKRGDDNVLHVRMQNPARLIGRDGETVDDLQFLLNRMLARGEEPAPRVIVRCGELQKRAGGGLVGGNTRDGGEGADLGRDS